MRHVARPSGRVAHDQEAPWSGALSVPRCSDGRLVAILVEATGQASERCSAVLAEAAGDVKVALVSLLSDVPVASARTALDRNGGIVRAALNSDATS